MKRGSSNNSEQQLQRWLLPDGVGEVLPPLAGQIESLRRELLDLYASWGYELIIPPLLEFVESLLLNTNRDLDLQTFKVTDQISGRTMGLRADITPQAARIDAHSLDRQGPARLCYASSVLHTVPSNALASRSPIQLGVECFGITELMADCEVIGLMIETLRCAGISDFVINLGHVEVVRALVDAIGLKQEQSEALLDILQRKASVELTEFIAQVDMSPDYVPCCQALLNLHGGIGVLSDAEPVVSVLGEGATRALADLKEAAGVMQQRYPEVTLQFDLAEAPGYHYHNGIVFAAYVEGSGAAVANGGRYDALSNLFGRSRPATGFNADLKTLARLGAVQSAGEQSFASGIAVVASDDPAQWEAITALRADGERVVILPEGAAANLAETLCNRQLVLENGQYVVKPVAA